jgi:hypothetical protein
MTVFGWAFLVMGVDVSHVYSTLYRTYFDPETMQRHRLFLSLLPLAVFLGCIAAYSLGSLNFWRIMAYLAVFHFARQQYGFMRVYSRREISTTFCAWIDKVAIYTATFYPILNWHFSGQKNFNWFMKGDFYYLNLPGAQAILLAIYLFVILLYSAKELRSWYITRRINIPRNGIILGTLISWYVGIVHFNSDLAFTAINVISHGIPYMALVWIYGRKKYGNAAAHSLKSQRYNLLSSRWSWIFRPRALVAFLGVLFIFAYVEEGFWNVWVWHETLHRAFFQPFHSWVFSIPVGSGWLGIVVPLLSVPQITHYIIDGFIWKMRTDDYGWRDITLGESSARPS